MFSFLDRKIKYKVKSKGNEGYSNSNSRHKLYSSLFDNINMVKNILSCCDDLNIREFNINDDKKTKAAIIFLNALIAKTIITNKIL